MLIRQLEILRILEMIWFEMGMDLRCGLYCGRKGRVEFWLWNCRLCLGQMKIRKTSQLRRLLIDSLLRLSRLSRLSVILLYV
jgi:hypothetical protein